MTSFRHGKELRDAQLKAEEIFQKARAEDSAKHVPLHKYDALNRSLKDTQDAIVNQKTALEKKLRGAQDAERSAREEIEEAQNDLASMDRQHKHTLREIESRLNTLTQTANVLRSDLDNKSKTLKATQDRLSKREVETGELESEILHLKAQTGDSETLGVIKRELSEQVAHIRQLEKMNREQAEELKVFKKRGKAVEVVEEEKRVLESKLGLLDDAQKQLREAQLQRQILEDERKSWAAYLENEGSTAYETPEEVAKALVRQRLDNASLIQQKGELQAEQLEKDEVIKTLESQRSTIQAELDSLKSSTTTTNATTPADAPTSTSTLIPNPPSTTSTTDSRTKQRLEKHLSFAKKEIALMREQLRSFDSEEQTYHPDSKFDAAKSARIADLEALLDESRKELADLTAELSALETKLSTSADSAGAEPGAKSPLKRSHGVMEGEGTGAEAEGGDLVGQLSRKLRKLQDTVGGLQAQNAVLTSENSATQTQLRQLQKSARTRVLSLRSNPTADYEAVKLETLQTLRRENKDLLASSLEKDGDGGRGAGKRAVKMVPISTLDAMRLELREREQEVSDKEKRMLRLKQIWGSKTQEFREAVFSLLGWKMEFRGDGKFVLSLNTGRDEEEEDDDDGGGGRQELEDESFIFDGEKGTMKVSGGSESAFAQEVKPYFKRWVGKEGWIPGLMASVLLGKVEGGLEGG